MDERKPIFSLVDLQSHEAHLPGFALLKHDWSDVIKRLDRDDFETLAQIKPSNLVCLDIVYNGLFAIIASFLVDFVLGDVELEDIVAEGENEVAFVVA